MKGKWAFYRATFRSSITDASDFMVTFRVHAEGLEDAVDRSWKILDRECRTRPNWTSMKVKDRYVLESVILA